jgi:hypothetical protein
LRARTYSLLASYRDVLLRRHGGGRIQLPDDQVEGVSFDFAVLSLLERERRRRGKNGGGGKS